MGPEIPIHQRFATEDGLDELYPMMRNYLRRSFYQLGLRRAHACRIPLSEFRDLVVGVVNDTITAARVAIDTYDPRRGMFLSWMFLLGRRLLASAMRAASNHQRAIQNLARGIAEEDWEKRHGTRDFRMVLVRDQLARAMVAVPEDQVQALCLHYLLQLSMEEVGRVMGRSEDAVKSMLSRARENLRARLEGVPARKRGRAKKEESR